MKRLIFRIQIILAPVLLLLVLFPLFLLDAPWPEAARDYLQDSGVEDTGAVNLVSSIYLGYRVFDTLGETIVLVVAVSGTIGLIAHSRARGTPVSVGKQGARSPAEAEEEKRAPFHRHRTVLMEVVTGKLGPVVLVFGLYVMLFGHVSPGGGFQGGVVIASGLVFLFMGTRGDMTSALARTGMLARLEAGAFILFVAASLAGVAVGAGFFANPFSGTPVPPEAFIVLLNTIIGLKVGGGMAYMCVVMMGELES